MTEQEKFLDIVEKVYGEKGKDMRYGLETHLKRTKQKIVDSFPVTESEHNWFDGAPCKENLQRILNGYELVIEDEHGKRRYIGYAYLTNELIDYWKKHSEERKKAD